ncbi:unnamed protein product, partial [Ectocarpus fasciculatus]
MATGLLTHGALSFLSGLSVAITGFDCDSAREILTELAPDSSAFDASSAINMGFSAGLVTAVQAVLLRRLINGALLLNMLPLTFIGVVLSLNVFSVSVLAALVPALGACLLGLSLAKLWMELADCRHETSVREGDDDRSRSWKWTGVLSVASLTGGLLSGSCPPPGPAFMVVLLAAGIGDSGDALAVGGGEWRATAALVTCSASLLRVGLLLLENGAAVGPLPEVSGLVLGGLAGLGIGNLSLRLLCRGTSESKNGSANSSTVDAYRWHDTPPAAALRRSVLAVALVSSIAMAAGGPPAALAAVSRPVVAMALAASLLVASCGALWG